MELAPSSTPIQQPPGDDLRNARTIAKACAHQGGEAADFQRIDELIGAALEKLGEPHPVTIDRAAAVLGTQAASIFNPTHREARDAAAVITSAALEWR